MGDYDENFENMWKDWEKIKGKVKKKMGDVSDEQVSINALGLLIYRVV